MGLGPLTRRTRAALAGRHAAPAGRNPATLSGWDATLTRRCAAKARRCSVDGSVLGAMRRCRPGRTQRVGCGDGSPEPDSSRHQQLEELSPTDLSSGVGSRQLFVLLVAQSPLPSLRLARTPSVGDDAQVPAQTHPRLLDPTLATAFDSPQFDGNSRRIRVCRRGQAR